MAAVHQHQQEGVVIRFFNNKGYSFIKPDSFDKDLFVHHTEIQCEGYRSLQEGQKVKFSVSVKNGKKVAVNVTASDGSNIVRRRRDIWVDGADRCSNCGGVGHLARFCSIRCYTCKGVCHIARDCTRGTGHVRGCYQCGDDGHFVRDCTYGCYTCGEEGHTTKECTSFVVAQRDLKKR